MDPLTPIREVRASFDERTIRVYQAYSPAIATSAVRARTFVPPFKRERMTWVKPSFTWMMYRSGWATKPDQERILGIDVTREGFEWALAHSASSDACKETLQASPVRIQWDPERSVTLEALPWRAIQVGLGGDAVRRYVDEWIVRLEDVTPLAKEIEARLARDDRDAAEALRPEERTYPLPQEIADRIGCTRLG